ncbi:MAG: alkaline phosphatase family protein [Methylococcaceae bacterium]
MFQKRFSSRLVALTAATLFAAIEAHATPKVIVISLDGAEPTRIRNYLNTGVLPSDKGLGLLRSKGVMADRNVTVSPSLTAVSHIAIATGSTAARNDIPANTFHLMASPMSKTISGFGAPIGGYSIDGPLESADPTAEPLWVALRAAGKKVVAATWPGADGATITAPGIDPVATLQTATNRTVDYTVPFGTYAGPTGTGFTLKAADFSAAPQTTIDQLKAAGRSVYGDVLQKTTPLETFTTNGVSFSIQVVALDTVDDKKQSFDTLVFFDATNGIKPGPFSLPSTGPAYVKAATKQSAPFFYEGTPNKVGTAFFVSRLDADLAEVHIGRYSGNYIPRNAPVLANVDDANNNVGSWAPQADYRIPERLGPGFGSFTDAELEAMYEDQVRLFVDYQTRMVLRAIDQNPDADLLMTYIEQPDGSGHQFMLIDGRQATNPADPNTIGAGQDKAKTIRYAGYLRTAYQAASNAVQKVIEKVGINPTTGKPNSDIIVVSDHGFAPFHTAVSLNNYLANQGIDTTKVRAITSGPAVNIYINLEGRENGGMVSRAEYVELMRKVETALWKLTDDNAEYTKGKTGMTVFDRIYTRPIPPRLDDPKLGRTTAQYIGQDSGDLYALLRIGYNFDGAQNPVVVRKGDTAATTPQLQVMSVPNFYGAHGYAPEYSAMSATFIAAGPDIGMGKLDMVHNIDVAPTLLNIFGVAPASTVQGKVINLNGTP